MKDKQTVYDIKVKRVRDLNLHPLEARILLHPSDPQWCPHCGEYMDHHYVDSSEEIVNTNGVKDTVIKSFFCKDGFETTNPDCFVTEMSQQDIIRRIHKLGKGEL